MTEEYKWRERLEQERREKDKFLANSRQSPIPSEKRKSFRGLDYYPLEANS